jgi:ATP-dependent Clp protease ATP-binding subunit ClpC
LSVIERRPDGQCGATFHDEARWRATVSTGYYGPGEYGSGPFDEGFGNFPGPGGPRRGQPIDITRLMSGPARELLASTARQAADSGRADLDTEHLLWAATRLEPTWQLLSRAGADPDALARDIEQAESRGPSRIEPPARAGPWTSGTPS